MLIVPFLFQATIASISRYQKRSELLHIIVICLAACTLFSLLQSPISFNSPLQQQRYSSVDADAIDDLLRMIPPTASVSANQRLLPKLCLRQNVYTFPNPFYEASWGATVQALEQQEGRGYRRLSTDQYKELMNHAPVDFIVIHRRTQVSVPEDIYLNLVTALLQSHAYGIIACDGKTLVLRRGADYTTGLLILFREVGKPMSTAQEVAEVYGQWRIGSE